MNTVEDVARQLEEIYRALDELHVAREEAKLEALPQEVRDALAEIEAEFDGRESFARDKARALEELLKEMVTDSENTVTVPGLQVVYVRGKVSWDRALEGYVDAHPELDKYRKVGKPFVQFRRGKE